MDKDLLEYLQAFREEMVEQLGVLWQRVDAGFHSMRQENAQRFEKLETEVRGAHIAVEDLRDKVQIVAEGVTGVAEQLKKQGEDFSERLDTLEAFTRLSYKDLDLRVRKLEAT